MTRTSFCLRPVLLTALLAAAAPAHAAVTWLCGLSQDLVRLECVADTDPTADDASRQPVTGRVGATTFPLDTRRRYQVELWTPPSEPDFVMALAEATICWRTPDCTVILRLPPEIGGAPMPAAAKARGRRS
jgi:hypothetical protein